MISVTLVTKRLRPIAVRSTPAARAITMRPVAPTVAWHLGEKANDPVASYLADIFTLSISLAGLPGMSVPAGFGEGGMPVGLQLVGNYLKEPELLQTAHQFQQVTSWHTASPKESVL